MKGSDIFVLPTPLQPIHNDITRQFKVQLFMKRDDLIHPEISGNKWRKLKYNTEQARLENKATLLTFGGAYSNHITATAAAGRLLGFKTIGIIRGEEYQPLNKSLQFAVDSGMQLYYINRAAYKDKQHIPFTLFPDLDSMYVIPEGGANALAVKGCAEIPEEIQMDFDYICCACGTGTTLAGMAGSLKSHQQAVGFPVLKNGAFLSDEIKRLTTADFQLITDYHFGGYAKTTPQLIQFIKDFYAEHHILLDYVYTGKMMYGIMDLIAKNHFPPESVIVAVHTGGVMNANVFD
ncbi:MAG: 1-aminocyclopropane-1-carboxylate deaminase/D-cysteine desulfhydrase [Sphingobacteriales bacterium]|nr:1-aminocyclopropane-1-carboxylate deaminase/D-cysteine desulfhydrase [Sphingobacteriales bacterium]